MRIGVAGCTGRMGRMLTEAVCKHGIVTLSAVSTTDALFDDASVILAGYSTHDVMLHMDSDAFVQACDAVIDFTSPDYSLELGNACAAHDVIHICGTTGFSESQQRQLHAYDNVLVHAANFSLGVNMLIALTQRVAATLDDAYDIEISETHHRHKKDAPSGTALALGEAAAAGRQIVLSDVADRGRDGMTGERSTGAIGFHALRGGDVIGDHTVLFAADGERIELTHKASHRRIYADGAIRAALWANDKPHGNYTMQDVIDIT